MDRPLARIALAFALFALVGLILSWVGRGRDPSTSRSQAPSEADPSAWRKAPTYLLLNLVFLAVILAPARFGLFPLFLGLVGILAAAELLRAIARVPDFAAA